MKQRQLTWSEANKLAELVADRSLGINPPKKPVMVTTEEVRAVAHKAAMTVIHSLGLLDAQNAADQRRLEEQVRDIRAREGAYRARRGGVMV